MNQSPADAFRQKLEERRAAQGAEAFPMEFAGFPCKVRRLTRIFFVRAGRMPEHLVNRLIAQSDTEGGAASLPERTAAEIVAGEVFFRQAVCAVLVEPQVVEKEPVPEGGYLYADLEESAPEFVRAVYQWVIEDCPMPDSEVGKGGEAETLRVKDLENFPDGGGGHSSGDARDAGAQRRAPAVGANASRRKRAGRK